MIKHHYWEPPIALYLFLGGLAGGILFLSAVFNTFVLPGYGEIFALPVLVAIVCICIGLVCLLIDLGQPLVFWRVFVTAKSVIKWGAVFLVISMVFGLVFDFAYILAYFGITALVPIAGGCLFIAGFFGLCVMMYTGIMLSTLKAHAFWSTPALPVLFTISAVSTGCAAVVLFINGWPATGDAACLEAAHEVLHILHIVDIVLVCCEIVVLLTMVLSLWLAGNVTAMKAAGRWVRGSYKFLFWVCMIGCGLLIPLVLYVAGGSSHIAAEVVAPILVLCGGCLLRFMIVNTDDRAPLPGEERYMGRVAKYDAQFVKEWTYGKNLY